MTAPELETIRQRAEKATEGPWRAKPCADAYKRDKCCGIAPAVHNHSGDDCYDYEREGFTECPASTEIVTTDSGYYGPKWDDAEFIAHAREDVPALLDEVARLQGLLDRTMLLADEWCNGEYRFRHFGRDLQKLVRVAIPPSTQDKI